MNKEKKFNNEKSWISWRNKNRGDIGNKIGESEWVRKGEGKKSKEIWEIRPSGGNKEKTRRKNWRKK